jgi:hypothetical protein
MNMPSDVHPLREILRQVIDDPRLNTDEERDAASLEKAVALVVHPDFLTLVPDVSHRASLISLQIRILSNQFDGRFGRHEEYMRMYQVVKLSLRKSVKDLRAVIKESKAKISRGIQEQQRLIIDLAATVVNRKDADDEEATTAPAKKKRKLLTTAPTTCSKLAQDLASNSNEITKHYEKMHSFFNKVDTQEKRARHILPLFRAFTDACDLQNRHRGRWGTTLFQLWSLVIDSDINDDEARNELNNAGVSVEHLREQIKEHHETHKSLLKELDASIRAIWDAFGDSDERASLKSLVAEYTEKLGPDYRQWDINE